MVRWIWNLSLSLSLFLVFDDADSNGGFGLWCRDPEGWRPWGAWTAIPIRGKIRRKAQKYILKIVVLNIWTEVVEVNVMVFSSQEGRYMPLSCFCNRVRSNPINQQICFLSLFFFFLSFSYCLPHFFLSFLVFNGFLFLYHARDIIYVILKGTLVFLISYI